MTALDKLMRRVKSLEQCQDMAEYPPVVIIDVPETVSTISEAARKTREIRSVSPRTIVLVFTAPNTDGTLPQIQDASVFDKEDRDL